MAKLIPQGDLTTLLPAYEVKEIASEALFLQEEQSIAATINQAANCGEHRVTYARKLSNEMQEKLESLGYTVNPDLHAADPNLVWIIGGF